jgi:large subunit ribosomal protein L17
MRHHNQNRKFGRTKNQRKALLKALAVSLITREKIETTLPKAKELRPFIEKLLTSARRATLSDRRGVVSQVGARAGKKLLDVVGPKYKDRKGGYTRIVKTGSRKKDASPRAIIEFV